MGIPLMTEEKARPWRRAILGRAQEKGQKPVEVVDDFWPVMKIRPQPISEAEILFLSRDFPFSPEDIREAFSREVEG